jgi:hypothetical protein
VTTVTPLPWRHDAPTRIDELAERLAALREEIIRIQEQRSIVQVESPK